MVTPEWLEERRKNQERGKRTWEQRLAGMPPSAVPKRNPWAYPLPKANYRLLVRVQEGRCALCHRVPRVPLVQDHDHETGLVRALLCHGCNSGLGKFGDSIEGLMLAVRYLEEYG